eukprot:COSAG01_NODE_18984_length_1039_cov_1.063830_1_plen_41_part_10
MLELPRRSDHLVSYPALHLLQSLKLKRGHLCTLAKGAQGRR